MTPSSWFYNSEVMEVKAKINKGTPLVYSFVMKRTLLCDEENTVTTSRMNFPQSNAISIPHIFHVVFWHVDNKLKLLSQQDVDTTIVKTRNSRHFSPHVSANTYLNRYTLYTRSRISHEQDELHFDSMKRKKIKIWYSGHPSIWSSGASFISDQLCDYLCDYLWMFVC